MSEFSGPIVYVANVMTQAGETGGFTVSDHVRAITSHVGKEITDVLIHSEVLPEELIKRYRAEDAAPTVVDTERLVELGVTVHERDLLSETLKMKV